MTNRRLAGARIVRQAVVFAAFVVGAAACESVLGLKHGRPFLPEPSGGEAGENTGGIVGDSAGGNSSGRGGAPPIGGGGAGGEGFCGDGVCDANEDRFNCMDCHPCSLDEDCPNTDPDCRMECRWTGATMECVAVGADFDEDDYLSAACEANPGDDCDDGKKNVHPDAEEICDGLDNDCDETSDFEEFGVFPVRPVWEESGTFDADIAWSEQERTWGVVFDARNVKYQPIDVDGVPRSGPTALTMHNAEPSGVAIEWGDDEFVVAYRGGYDADIYFNTIPASGWPVSGGQAPLADIQWSNPSAYPAWLWLGPGRGWAATWTDFRDQALQVFTRTVAPDGTLGAELQLGVGEASDFAIAGGIVMAVWHANGSQGSVGTDGLELASPLVFPTESPGAGERPIIASSVDRFLVAARYPPDKFGIMELDANGRVICGPVTIEADGFVPGDSVAASAGFLVFSATPVVQMLEVLPGCRFARLIPIDTTAADFVRVAGRANGSFGVIWGGIDQPLEGRFFGPNFCD